MTTVRFLRPVFLLLCLVLSAEAQVLFNEILVNPVDGDDNREYIELFHNEGGGDATGFYVLQLDGNGTTNRGRVVEVWDLNGLLFGANGLLLLGDGYTNTPPGGPWSHVLDAATSVGDPVGFGSGNILNGTYTWLLVSDFAGFTGQDLDTDDDGELDVQPFRSILDGVGWTDGGLSNYVYTAARLEPSIDAATRVFGNLTPQSSNAWYGGDLLTNHADRLGQTYDPDKGTFNQPCGAALTPGSVNYKWNPPEVGVRINEVYINPIGADDEREFVELLCTSNRPVYLNGLWLLEFDSAGTNIGSVVECWNLQGLQTGTNGLALLGNKYNSPEGGPWSNVVSLATRCREPGAYKSSGWGKGDVGDNTDFTLLLVLNFTGEQGTDLDLNNDGMIDVSAWDAVVDSIGFGLTYSPARLTLGFSPDVVARVATNRAANSPLAWYGGDVVGASNSVTFDALTNRFALPSDAHMSPGTVNGPLMTDSDEDGMADYWEEQFLGGTVASANDDADGDHLSNLQEYIAGSHPDDDSDVYEIIQPFVPGTNGGVWIQWLTLPGRLYSLYDAPGPEYRITNLVQQTWGDGSKQTFLDPATQAKRIYRVGIRIP